MKPITTLDQLLASMRAEPSRHVAVAAGHDPNTIGAAAQAAAEDIARITLVGDGSRIAELCGELGLDAGVFTVVDEPDVLAAGAKAATWCATETPTC